MLKATIRRSVCAALIAAAFGHSALADDNMKIAIGQRGGWEQSVSELGQNKGIFKKQAGAWRHIGPAPEKP